MENNKEKIYVNGVFLREKELEFGTIIQCDIVNVTEFADQLINNANEKGKITIDIKRRQEKSDTGITHYFQVSTFTPKEQTNQPQQQPQPQNVTKNESNSDGMPF